LHRKLRDQLLADVRSHNAEEGTPVPDARVRKQSYLARPLFPFSMPGLSVGIRNRLAFR
jgi:hypothetical protein